jgi:hypothetical protein
MPIVGPDRCPDCGVALDELPPPNRCPDCGFEYDEHTRVWRSGKSWQHYAVGHGLIGLVLALVLAVSYRLVRGEVPHPAFPLLFALAYAGVGLLIRRVLMGRLSGRFVAITPRGVLVGTRRRSALIGWEDVERLSHSKGVPKLRRRSSGVAVPLEDIFNRPEDLATFRMELKAGRQRYADRRRGE